MNRRAPIAVTALVASTFVLSGAVAGAVTGAEKTAATAKGQSASVRVLECVRGKTIKGRSALFRGQMMELSDSDRMEMRFNLSERVGRGPWQSVSAPGLDIWHEARPGVAKFAYRQRIELLQKGTAYRMTVSFRWFDAEGAVISSAMKRSGICRQPGKLPNLKFRGVVRVKPGPTPDTVRYIVQVANTGFVEARKFDVALRIADAEVDARVIGRLRGGDRRTIRFVGPACTGPIETIVDHSKSVREITEQDNVVTAPCFTAS